jgi:hypothetical protein
VVPGDFSSGVKRLKRESDYFSPSSVEVKTGGAILSRHHKASWHGDYLIKHKENFNFTFFQATRLRISGYCLGAP